MIEESSFEEALRTETRSAHALISNAIHQLDLALARPDALPYHPEIVDSRMQLLGVVEKIEHA